MTTPPHSLTVWPKTLPILTKEQAAIREDFVKHWLGVLPQRYGVIEQIKSSLCRRAAAHRRLPYARNRWRARRAPRVRASHRTAYTVLELRPELAEEIHTKYPQVAVLVRRRAAQS